MTCCTIAFEKTLAMPTTQFARAIQYEDAASWPSGRITEHTPRMSWIVVTDNDGNRRLQIKWERATENRRSTWAAV
jgi:hypothetical protein